MINISSDKQINNLGFTLIELIVVMVIISITVALAVPNFNKILGSYQLDISAREMASDIRDLQQTVVKKQDNSYLITWDKTTGTYYLCTGITSYKTVKLPTSVDLTESPLTEDNLPELFFDISGRPKHGFGGTVKLTDKNTGKNKFVIIDTLGRVRVSDTYS